MGREGLELLAWAGACEAIGGRDDLRRREDLWQLGVARGGRGLGAGRAAEGANGAAAGGAAAAPIQLSLPLPIPAAPSLRELDSWERLVADYGSVGIAIAEHPMALLRPSLESSVASSADLDGVSGGRPVEIAGMVVARQRPATAHGVVFMLLEDELGTINVVVPPPVYARHRLAVRTASFARVSGKLERRAGVVNVVASAVRPLATPDQPRADVRQIEPPAERETGRRGRRRRARAGGCRGPGHRAGRRRAGRPQLRPPRAMTPDASSLAERMFRPPPRLALRLHVPQAQRLGQRTLSGVDLAIDFATLGEYGLEPVSADGPVASEPAGDPQPLAGPAGRRWRRPAAAPVERGPTTPPAAARVALPRGTSREPTSARPSRLRGLARHGPAPGTRRSRPGGRLRRSRPAATYSPRRLPTKYHRR